MRRLSHLVMPAKAGLHDVVAAQLQSPALTLTRHDRESGHPRLSSSIPFLCSTGKVPHQTQ
jgi:hypothetical protein